MVSTVSARVDAVAFNLVDEAEFARRLRRRPSSLAEAVKAKRIFFVEDHGQRSYPSFFVDPIYCRSDLYRVSRTLGALTGGSKLQFFAHPKASLGGITPLTALQRGMRVQVLRSAEGFAER